MPAVIMVKNTPSLPPGHRAKMSGDFSLRVDPDPMGTYLPFLQDFTQTSKTIINN